MSEPVAGSVPQQVFRSNVDGITIPVSVKTRNRPVENLTAEDFELRDNGVLQRIQTFDAGTIPLDLTLMLDASTSVDGRLLQELKGAVAEMTTLLHDNDRLRLIAISQVLREVFPLRPRGAAMPLDALRGEGGTSLYDALAVGMMRRADPGRRQLVIVFTDGQDSTSIIDEATTKDIARRSDAVVDIVVPVRKEERAPDRPASSAPRQQSLDTLLSTGSNVVSGSSSELAERARALQPWARKEATIAVLSELAAAATGQVLGLESRESIGRGFKRMLEEYRASYVLQYVPTGVDAAGWHTVTVTVKKPGRFDVLARKGYQSAQ